MTKEHEGQLQPGARAGSGFFHRSLVHRQGNGVIRETGPWTPTVHSLLRHLDEVDFPGAPRVMGSGFTPDGREVLTFIDGEFMHPGQPTVEAAAAVAQILRQLHEATASFRPPDDARWQPLFARNLGGPAQVISHCDVGPWNVVTRDGLPVALIDWDFAGPIDPMVELAHACVRNANLYSDDIPERDRLPPLGERARQLRAMVDAYGLSRQQRLGFLDGMIEFVVHSMANDADEAEVTPDMKGSDALWALAWQARTAAWLLRNRSTFDNALT